MTKANRYGLSRAIGEQVKRAVRQRSCFGCVVCGAAVYQYHHFDPPFEDAREHRSEGITLLCGACHDKVTRGIWSSEKIEKHVQEPFCASHSPHVLLDLEPPLHLLVGSILLSGVGPLLVVDGETLVGLEMREGEGLALSATIPGGEGGPLVRIDRNELVLCKPTWDVSVVGRKIVIRHGPRDVALELVVHPPHGLHLSHLDLAVRGIRLSSDKSGRIELSNQGKPALVAPKDHVMHVGGRIEFVGERVQFTEGVAWVPFPSSRVNHLVRTGELARLTNELRQPRLDVAQPVGSDEWCVQAGRFKRPFNGFAEAKAWAVGIGLLVADVLVVVHHLDGDLEFLPPRS